MCYVFKLVAANEYWVIKITEVENGKPLLDYEDGPFQTLTEADKIAREFNAK
jgi:hypothetical protein